ncbi:MAG: ribosome biogenesis GTP-binding protein YsxC [Bacteriovoracaceae bacterium]|nr:ribosome biogenesis GTP-binding protein YsxC [Bacteriovoracaceae bacterium]
MGISNPDQLKDWLEINSEKIGLVFAGRSNVGKSSLINTLFGKNTARISRTPGRTKVINIFTFEINSDGKKDDSLPELFLFDLPGYGYAEISKEMSRNWDQLMHVFFSNLPKKSFIINIQDARHPNQKPDMEFQSFLKNFDLETTMVFNKIDKLKKQKEKSQLNKLKPKLIKEFKWVKFVHFVSAEKRTGTNQLENSMITSIINRIDN